MLVELRNIEEIKPYARNPRDNDHAVAAVAESIRQFGFRQPIVVDETWTIIAGHTRYKAALLLGMKKVPVHVATDLTPAQIKAYRLADNKTAELADWNHDRLVEELRELEKTAFDLDLLGFSPEELQELCGTEIAPGLIDPDEIPEPPDAAVTQRGDLWMLGEHRLLCGDAGKPADVDCLLDGLTVHMANLDPVYNVKVEPRSNNAIAAGLSSFQTTHHQKLDVVRHPEKAKPTTRKLRAKDRPLANDFVSETEFDRLLRAWFGNLARVLLPGRCFVAWSGYSNIANYPSALRECGLYFSQAIVWDKVWPVLGRKCFMGAYELAFFGWREGAAHQFFGPNNEGHNWSLAKKPLQRQSETITL